MRKDSNDLKDKLKEAKNKDKVVEIKTKNKGIVTKYEEKYTGCAILKRCIFKCEEVDYDNNGRVIEMKFVQV